MLAIQPIHILVLFKKKRSALREDGLFRHITQHASLFIILVIENIHSLLNLCNDQFESTPMVF